jgi:hypothetical protein
LQPLHKRPSRAAQELVEVRKADAQIMRKLGSDVNNDPETFASFDTTDLNSELDKLGDK